MYKKKVLRFILLFVVSTALIGCEKGLDISNAELVKKSAECMADETKTPGMAVVCGNYQKECARRGKATGNYVC